ncbi:hypothetical protein [Salinibacter sp. 10B]|uniref:hypothetical protein n=1 Tax=Salinibacter sp. 10B TaxID=1923971 RepID=UPI0011B02CC4|nr:hypothetical protein [Salinibacter sp. 10B]
MAVVSTVLMDPISQRQLHTRGAPRPDTLRTLLDVRRHFDVPRYLMLDVHEVPVAGTLQHRLETGGRLIFRSVGGEETREVRVAAGHLRIVPDTLMGLLVTSEEHGTAPPPVMLHWVSPEETRLLAAVHPVAPSPGRVAQEVRALVRVVRAQDRPLDDVRREVYGFLQDAYGTPYRPHVEAWMDQHLGQS